MSEKTVRQNGEIARPVRVDDEFFLSLNRILDEVRDESLRAVAAKHGIRLEGLIAHATQVCADPTEEMKRDWLRRDLSRAAEVDYWVYLEGGYSLSFSDESQLKETLRFDPNRARHLAFQVGVGGPVTLRIEVSATTGIGYSISGSRKDVHHYAKAVRELGTISEPPLAVLRTAPAKGFLLAAISSSVIFGLFMLLEASWETAMGFGLVAAFALLCIVLSFGLAMPTSRAIERLLPFVEFDYGLEARRRMEKRKALAFVAVTIALPWLLNLAAR